MRKAHTLIQDQIDREQPPGDAERRTLSAVPERFFDDTTHGTFLANKVGYFWRDRDGRRMGL
jgi:hypothetical protein